MPKGTILYYVSPSGENPINDFLDSLQDKQQSKILRILNNIKMYGLDSLIPHLKKLTGTPLWEIRILGRDNIRILYVIKQKDSILVLHGFIKKQQKTPIKEISNAISRIK